MRKSTKQTSVTNTPGKLELMNWNAELLKSRFQLVETAMSLIQRIEQHESDLNYTTIHPVFIQPSQAVRKQSSLTAYIPKIKSEFIDPLL